MKEEANNQLPMIEDVGNCYRIRFNEQTEDRENEDGTVLTAYIYDALNVPKPFDMEATIDALIRSRYSRSRMEAIQNNYTKDNRTEDDVRDHKDMQEWRTQSKSIAKAAAQLLQKT